MNLQGIIDVETKIERNRVCQENGTPYFYTIIILYFH